MTSSWHRFALKGGFAVAAALAVTGCGSSDGRQELADGVAAYGVRDFGRSDKLLTKALECAPDCVDALVASARTKLALGELPEATKLLVKAAELSPGDADIVLLGAQLAYHNRDFKSAADTFTEFAADASRPANLRADAYVGLAVVEMTCNEIDSARLALLRAQALDRHNSAARYHLGILYRNLGYLEAAQDELRAYLMLDKTADARMQRVNQQVMRDINNGIALKASERPGADKRDISAARAPMDKANAEAKKGNWKAASQQYQKALTADPLSYDAALGLAQSIEKFDKSAEGRNRALANYRIACALQPSATATLVKTGALAFELRNYATATEAYSRACAANPRSIDAIDGLIRSLRKSGTEGARVAALWQKYRDEIYAARKKGK